MTPTVGGGFGGYGEATQQAIVITCAVCSTPNGPGERYCQDCGFMFGSATGEIEPLPDASQMARLVDATGRELLLNSGINVVGRDSADVLLPDSTVSRRHAQITLNGDQVTVEDLGSTNGSSVAGRKLGGGETATAYAGDSLKFGNLIFTLQLPGGAARPAEATTAPAPAEAPVDRGAPVGFFSREDGSEIPLFAGVNTLGRRSTNQIVLADSFASGSHAEIRWEGNSGVVVDVGSTNGTFIGAERLAANVPVPLTEGLTIRFGKTSLKFRSSSAADSGVAEDAGYATVMDVPQAAPVQNIVEAEAPVTFVGEVAAAAPPEAEAPVTFVGSTEARTVLPGDEARS
jgi:pSer/pThr/pTyr-binding forkhead associated (FHA) protein